MKKVFVSVCLTILSVVGTANAALVSYTDSFNYSGSTAVPGNNTSSNLLLNRFDPTLGTLTGISLSSTTQLKAGLSITNNTGNSIQIYSGNHITSDPAWYATFPSGSGLYYDSGSITITGTVGTGKTTLWASQPHYMTQSIDIASNAWSSYEGTGSIIVNSGISNSAPYYGGIMNITPIGMASGDITINYAYDPTPTPIPSAFLLMGSGLIGLLGLRKSIIKL